MNANIRSTQTNAHKNIPNAAVAVLPFIASALVAVASLAFAIIVIAFMIVVFIIVIFISVVFNSVACISEAYNAGAIASISFAFIAATAETLNATAPAAASSFSRQKYHLLRHRVDIIV